MDMEIFEVTATDSSIRNSVGLTFYAVRVTPGFPQRLKDVKEASDIFNNISFLPIDSGGLLVRIFQPSSNEKEVAYTMTVHVNDYILRSLSNDKIISCSTGQFVTMFEIVSSRLISSQLRESAYIHAQPHTTFVGISYFKGLTEVELREWILKQNPSICYSTLTPDKTEEGLECFHCTLSFSLQNEKERTDTKEFTFYEGSTLLYCPATNTWLVKEQSEVKEEFFEV